MQNRAKKRIKLWLAHRAWRPLLLAGVAVFVLTEIVALSPSSIEEGNNASSMIEPDTLIPKEQMDTVIVGIPKGVIPDYRVEKFEYLSSQGAEKQWKLLADTAAMYHKGKEDLTHAIKVNANLYDPDGKITIVTGREAKYVSTGRDLEIYGDVVTTFPDGFQLQSDYLRYTPNNKKIEIPEKYFVKGTGKEGKDSNLSFQSQGLDYAMGRSYIILPKDAVVTMAKIKTAPDPDHPDAPLPKDNTTTIKSDRCEIDRTKQIAHFTMYASRPLKDRFVHILQPTLYARGRRAELNYGDQGSMLNYLTAYEDVFIRDTSSVEQAKYATGGRADFDNQHNLIILTLFPQVYQDEDTVTGDKILMHRDTDMVDIDNSNSFSQGN